MKRELLEGARWLFSINYCCFAQQILTARGLKGNVKVSGEATLVLP